MSDYNEIRNQVLSLTPEEQLRLIDEVLSMVRHRVVNTQRQLAEFVTVKV